MPFRLPQVRVLALLLGLLVVVTSCTATPPEPETARPTARPAPEPTPATPEPLEPDTMARRSFTPVAGDVPNPERGLHAESNLLSSDFAAVRDRGLTLTRSYVRLDEYRDAPLDDALLTALDDGFQHARDAGVKVILRFTYNFSITEPDAPQSRMLQHIDQLAPVLQDNSDVIAVLQAGFIGAWGEWHSSTNDITSPEERRSILDALLETMPESRTVQLRGPVLKQQLVGGPLSSNQAFGSTAAARVGFHNDCFLATEDDAGTFPAPSERWRDYLAQDSRYVMVGGETCRLDPPRSDCPTALEELERYNFTYLNGNYSPDVLNRWREQGCYEEVQRNLGYRFVLDEVAYPEQIAPGEDLALALTLRNEGWARAINPRPVYLVLESGVARHEMRLDEVDPRRWEPGGTSRVSVEVPVPSEVGPGTYRLSLWLPDNAPTLRERPDFAVRLANEDVWDGQTGSNVLVEDLRIG